MSILIYSLLALFLGLCLDYVLGDPRGWYHPVMAVGWLTVRLESLLRALFRKTKTGERLAGLALTALVVGISTLLPAGALTASSR